jgi:hypothetical protein
VRGPSKTLVSALQGSLALPATMGSLQVHRGMCMMAGEIQVGQMILNAV